MTVAGADRGGPIIIDNVQDADSAKYESILVLDTFRKSNELSFVADVRDDPLSQCDVDIRDLNAVSTRKVNADQG